MNPGEFEEIQVIGTRRVLKHIEAKLFPEKVFLHDLVFNYSAMADEISSEDYEQMKP